MNVSEVEGDSSIPSQQHVVNENNKFQPAANDFIPEEIHLLPNHLWLNDN